MIISIIEIEQTKDIRIFYAMHDHDMLMYGHID